ncbi:MAG: DUF2142 domain-containing protein [Candidatus Eremiobacterota bacterium]
MLKKINLLFCFSPHKSFLFISLFFGIIFLFVTPPFHTPDEPNHFYRAFQVSEFNSGISPIPASLELTVSRIYSFVSPEHRQEKLQIKNILSLLDIKLEPDNRKQIFLPGAKYSPVPYMPQAIAIFAGKLFNDSPLILMYGGRLFNLLAWSFLIYLAIKITPVFKWVIFLLALSPMSLFLAASLSADCMTNGLSFLFIALVLQYAFDKTKHIRYIDLLILFLLSILMSLCKQGCLFFIIFLFLLIPAEKTGSKKKFFFIFFLLILSSIITITLWSYYVRNYPEGVTRHGLKGYISFSKQLSFICAHPSIYCQVVLHTLITNRFFYLSSFIGNLGWLDTPLPDLLIYSYFIILILVSLMDNNKDIKILLKDKLIMTAISMVNLLGILTIFYLTWTPAGGEIILGCQGRYFIPSGPLFFLLFYHDKKI